MAGMAATAETLYRTPDGFDDLVMRSDGETLTELRFAAPRDAAKRRAAAKVRDLPVFRETRRWLDNYFGGRLPDFTQPYRL